MLMQSVAVSRIFPNLDVRVSMAHVKRETFLFQPLSVTKVKNIYVYSVPNNKIAIELQ